MVYTQSVLQGLVNSRVGRKVLNLISPQNTMNEGVRRLLAKVDLRTTKRKSTTPPNLFNGVYDYACPTDLKGEKIIDLMPQINRTRDTELQLVSPAYFDRRKQLDKNLVSFLDKSGVRKLRYSMNIDDDELVISELDSLTSSGGTWTAYGDAENLTIDNFNYVKGNGCINWDISSAGGTTAGIYNDDLDEFDLSDYLSGGSVFVWTYITSTTNLTNFILRIGSGAGAYYTQTVTTVNDGTAFVAGWNLLRFDFNSMTQTGTVDNDACNYVAIFMTKAGAKVSETDYRFDWLVIKRGAINDLYYYSKYGWQSNAAVWLENSTATTDLLNADTDEIDLILNECAIVANEEFKDWNTVDRLEKKQERDIKKYLSNYPSEALLKVENYYDF